jgi:hypothetical protein
MKMLDIEIERAGGNVEEGFDNYKNFWREYAKTKNCYGSKESMKVFLPISEFLKTNNIKHRFGYEDNKEWYIYDTDNRCTYFFDFAIPSINLLIEYNGEAWHPNPKWNKEKWDSWRRPHDNMSANDVYKKELLKEQCANKMVGLYLEYIVPMINNIL